VALAIDGSVGREINNDGTSPVGLFRHLLPGIFFIIFITTYQ
jgi:hypothetical protein